MDNGYVPWMWLFICIMVVMSTTRIMNGKILIEKEKTKQLQITLEIQQNQQGQIKTP